MNVTVENRGTYSRVLINETPDLLALHRLNPERYPYLLESVSTGTPQSRYSILFAYPSESIEITALHQPDFLSQLDQSWQQAQITRDSSPDELPFRGGWFLYLGYELAGQIEPRLANIPVSTELPIAAAIRIPAAIVHDHESSACWLVTECGAESLIRLMLEDLNQIQAIKPIFPLLESFHEDEPDQFLSAVNRTLDYCYEGDIFQANLSRRWSGALSHSSHYWDIYHQLRVHNPAPFAGLACFGNTTICSSSPERLIRVQHDRIDMRPIAGTRPRGKQGQEDLDHSEALLQNPKERAEHLMLLDLIRNDLGRVCAYGSVEVDEHMILESYATVHHIVSNVRGIKRPGVTPGDIIRAVFPGGTITGCPKVRCMEIINELELVPRGAYTGSMGYLNHNGDMDLNILIRTLVVDGNQLDFRAGAGIVADSIPESELLETRHKARGLLKSLGCA